MASHSRIRIDLIIMVLNRASYCLWLLNSSLFSRCQNHSSISRIWLKILIRIKNRRDFNSKKSLLKCTWVLLSKFISKSKMIHIDYQSFHMLNQKLRRWLWMTMLKDWLNIWEKETMTACVDCTKSKKNSENSPKTPWTQNTKKCYNSASINKTSRRTYNSLKSTFLKCLAILTCFISMPRSTRFLFRLSSTLGLNLQLCLSLWLKDASTI